jgi:hypothetical protein
MYAVIFDTDKIEACVAVPEKGNVTGTFNRDNVPTALIFHEITRTPSSGVRIIKLLHDNAPTHRSAFMLAPAFLGGRELRFCYILLIILTFLLETFGKIHTSNIAFAVAGSKPVVAS